jgi:hypothetical protein
MPAPPIAPRSCRWPAMPSHRDYVMLGISESDSHAYVVSTCSRFRSPGEPRPCSRAQLPECGTRSVAAPRARAPPHDAGSHWRPPRTEDCDLGLLDDGRGVCPRHCMDVLPYIDRQPFQSAGNFVRMAVLAYSAPRRPSRASDQIRNPRKARAQRNAGTPAVRSCVSAGHRLRRVISRTA